MRTNRATRQIPTGISGRRRAAARSEASERDKGLSTAMTLNISLSGLDFCGGDFGRSVCSGSEISGVYGWADANATLF